MDDSAIAACLDSSYSIGQQVLTIISTIMSTGCDGKEIDRVKYGSIFLIHFSSKDYLHTCSDATVLHRSETPCEHQNSKLQKEELQSRQSETVSLHYFHRNGTDPFLPQKRSETNVSSGSATSEHGLSPLCRSSYKYTKYKVVAFDRGHAF